MLLLFFGKEKMRWQQLAEAAAEKVQVIELPDTILIRSSGRISCAGFPAWN